jgi:hypothetical protein
VSHAGLVLLRSLADRTGLASGLSAALPSPVGGHDRGRVFSDLACAIADGAWVISDFRVMGDQRELLGPVASVPTAWRALKEAASGGERSRRKVAAAVNRARRHAWAQAGPLPPVRVADRKMDGITCVRLDATVVPAHSDKERAEPNFKGFGHHPLLAACDNTAEPLAWMLRPGSAGSNTAADHLRLVDEAVAALPPALRRKLMMTCDGAGASHELVEKLDKLASRHGYQLVYSVGWALGARERAAIGKAGLAEAPRPGRRPGQGRAEDPALPRSSRSRPPRPRRPPKNPQDRRDLAVGRRHRHRLAAHPVPPTTEETQGPVEPPTARPDSRATVIPRP